MSVLLVVVAAIAALLIYAASKPDQFRIERSAMVHAQPDKIFALLQDFHEWPHWSPWAKLDPDMKVTFSGAAQGVGSVYEWLGNNKVGQGRMEVLEVTSPTFVRIKLDFLKPFEAHNTAEFTLTQQTGGTQVTWAMFGVSPFMSKVMSLVFNMDKLVGRDFERGLSNLRRAVEDSPCC